MAAEELILDYASPRARGRVRLPAQSHIEIESDRDTTTVTESLKGRSSAIGAIVFAVFVLIVVMQIIVSQVAYWFHHPNADLIAAIIFSTIWLTEATLCVFVIDQTYRRTMLRVRDGEMSLTFSSLFSRTKTHCWPVAEIGELRVESTQSGPDVAPLAELQIRPARDVSVHLFTDHLETEVRHIMAVITRALNGDHEVPMAARPAIAAPDEATFKRLIETHRSIRESDRARQIGDSESRIT